jgi:hypothetical protein
MKQTNRQQKKKQGTGPQTQQVPTPSTKPNLLKYIQQKKKNPTYTAPNHPNLGAKKQKLMTSIESEERNGMNEKKEED